VGIRWMKNDKFRPARPRLAGCPCRNCNDDDEIRLPIPPAGMVYGIDTNYWKPVREGSNFEVPAFFGNENPIRFPLATGKSKKLYERAVAEGFIRADESFQNQPHSRWFGSWTAERCGLALAAFERLLVQARRA
jgi:hypothetical protein